MSLTAHVHGCKACASAMLRAIFGARPFVDSGAAYLDDMCDEGKRIAAASVTAKPPAVTIPSTPPHEIDAAPEGKEGRKP